MSDYQSARDANVATPRLPSLTTVNDTTGDTTLTPYDTNVLVVLPTAAVTRTVSLPAPVTCPGMKCKVKISKVASEAGNVTIVAADASAIVGVDGAADTFTGYVTNNDWVLFECVAGEFWLHTADLTSH